MPEPTWSERYLSRNIGSPVKTKPRTSVESVNKVRIELTEIVRERFDLVSQLVAARLGGVFRKQRHRDHGQQSNENYADAGEDRDRVRPERIAQVAAGRN